MNRSWYAGLAVLVLGLSLDGAAGAALMAPRSTGERPQRVRPHAQAGAPAGVARMPAVGRSVSVPLAGGGAVVVAEMWVGNAIQVRAQKLDDAGAPLWGPQGALVRGGLPDYSYPVVAPDGAGGAIVAWEDARNGEADVLAQRLDASGVATWAAGGLAICAAPLWQGEIALVPDGAGGAIVGWVDGRSGTTFDIYAQRVNGSGTVEWTADGEVVSIGAADQDGLVAADDGAGGAIFAWTDTRGADEDIYAQRMSGAGAAQWTADGVAVCASAGSQFNASAAPSAGRAIVAWTDAASGSDIRAQRIDFFTGAALWPTAGVALCADAADQAHPVAVTDGHGGAVVAWEDWRGADNDVYAQRVDSLGSVPWTADGVPVCTAAGSQGNTRLWPDGAGGAFATWEDWRAVGDVYAQHLDGTGARTWSPAGGVLVGGAADGQGAPSIVSDGGTGVVISWLDYRSYFDLDTYAQRLDAAGAPQWTANGVPAVVAPGLQMNHVIAPIGGFNTLAAWSEKWNGLYQVRACAFDSLGSPLAAASTLSADDGRPHLYPRIVPDGPGGAIVAWEDPAGTDILTDIRVQRVDGNAVPLWTTGGVHVCDAANDQWVSGLVADGSGGVIVLWQDRRDGQWDLYAQRVSGGGTVQWTADGVAVCTASGGRQTSALVPDNVGGAIAVWDDGRGASLDLYAQRMNGSGVMQWAADGVPVCTAVSDQRDVAAAADGSGGVVLAWSDYRGGSPDIYAQRLNASGTSLWTADGVVACAATGYQQFAQVVPDLTHGAIVSWVDSRAIGQPGLYAQRVDGSGATQWGASGTLAGSAAGSYLLGGTLVPDDAGGAIFAWGDARQGLDNVDVYAQRIDAAGNRLWAVGGVPVCTLPESQMFPSAASDGLGGAMIVWEDWRDGIQSVLFKQRIAANGVNRWLSDGETDVAVALRSATVIDGRVHLEWELDLSTPRIASVYRQAGDDEWVAIGTATSDVSGLVAFDDADVSPGSRYGYRIGLDEGGRETFSSPVWVSVPATAVFALESPRPNPVVGDLVVAFSLPRAGDARLELLDVGGRRVVQRTLASVPAGRSVVALAPRGALASGLYWLRITSGGESLARRVCVVR